MSHSPELGATLDQLVDDLDMAPSRAPAGRRRAGDAGPAEDGNPTLTLVEVEDRLVVGEGPVEAAARRRGRRGGGPAGKVRWQRELAALDRSQIGSALEKLDARLTPNRGLRRYEDGDFQADPAVPRDGRILVWVHGTFSNNESLLGGIESTAAGRTFLGWAADRYDRLLTFDHPTLSVSPVLNARALDRALRGTTARVDVICHSRGGLVARWWLEGFDGADPARRRVVFVGAPLAGTGLAAPTNLRASLSLLGNIGSALGAAAGAVPFLAVLTGVFRVVASVTKLAAKTPAIDAAVALVPGLSAQSRVGNNAELLSLRRSAPRLEGRYFAVRSNFESDEPGWRFWKYFRRTGDRARDVAADVVFDGENDLVVDTGSMVELTDRVTLPDTQVWDFGTTDSVHHTNYFEQPETLRFIRECLGA